MDAGSQGELHGGGGIWTGPWIFSVRVCVCVSAHVHSSRG